MLYEVKVLISYLGLYFANIVRTSTSGLNSKIVWFYASVKMNPIKLELKIDKREALVQQGCREGLGHFLSWWPFQTGRNPCWVVHVCAHSPVCGREGSGTPQLWGRWVHSTQGPWLVIWKVLYISPLRQQPFFPLSSFFLSLGRSCQSRF